MPKTTLTLDAWECLRCNPHYKWLNTRDKKPVRCPSCGSPYWDAPKLKKEKEEEEKIKWK